MNWALTVCNPWPYLMFLPDNDPRKKRIENRTWATNYRGPLLIHAGKSRARLHDYALSLHEERKLVFGAIVGQVDLVACVENCRLEEWIKTNPTFSWMRTHPHREGPFLWVLANAVKFAEPVACSGALQLWKFAGEVAR